MEKKGQSKTHPNISGTGIESTIKKLGRTIKNKFENIGEFSKKVVSGRNDYPPKVRAILEKVGDQKIKSIAIKRTPVNAVLTGTLSLFSIGKFGKRFEREFDELFHLFIELTLQNNKKVSLEKNEVINMDINPKQRPNTESETVNTPIPDLTLNEMLDNTEKLMGPKFFTYNLTNNNCQDFILSFFKANNIGAAEDLTFIKQDTKNLFNNLPILRKFANTLTDIGARADVLTSGAGLEDYEKSKEVMDAIEKVKGGKLGDSDYIVQSVVFDSDKYTVEEAKKWLKENNYKAPKVDREANTIRFRQVNNKLSEKRGYTNYRTKPLGDSKIYLVLAYKEEEMKGGKIEVHHFHHMINNNSCGCESDSDPDMEPAMKGGKIIYDSESNSDSDPDIIGGRVKRTKKFVKGSQEAKDHMARIRAMKKK
jgi:hypothetical protein